MSMEKSYYKVSLDKGQFTDVAQLCKIRLVNQKSGDVFGCALPINKQSELVLVSQYVPYTFFASPLLPIVYQLLLPLTIQNNQIGILELQRWDNLSVFSLKEIAGFQSVADEIASRLK